MSVVAVPEDGAVRVGTVDLPVGRRVYGWSGGAPRLWATSDPVPDAGRVWSELSSLSGDTGLVPIVLSFLDGGHQGRPWDEDELSDPDDVTAVDRVNVAQALADNWSGNLPDEEDEEWGEEDAEEIAPFGLRFPGLAPRQDAMLDDVGIAQALSLIGSARIGLVPASRPADVLALIGHDTISRQADPQPLAAILRSWEDRFGAGLLEVGFAHIRLLATRPPRTLRDAQAVAAELWAMCDEFWPVGTMSTALTSVSEIADYILHTPVWSLWLD